MVKGKKNTRERDRVSERKKERKLFHNPTISISRFTCFRVCVCLFISFLLELITSHRHITSTREGIEKFVISKKKEREKYSVT